MVPTPPFKRTPLANAIQAFDARQERQITQKAQATLLRREALIWRGWSPEKRRKIQLVGRHPVMYPKDAPQYVDPSKWMLGIEECWCKTRDLNGLIMSYKGVDP